jgi:hypothetical protein
LPKTKGSHVVFYWGVFFLLMFVKYSYYHFKYYPVMDDWIQYGTYSLAQNPFMEVVLKTKMYTIRPLAGISDVFIISRFWDKLDLVFFVITLMHIASCVFIVKVFQYNKIKTGYVFLFFYGLLPFGSEATYWISASSRLVVAMFWLSVAMFFMCRYLYQTYKKRDLILFFVFHLLSFSYYETVVILGFVGALLVVLPNIRKREGKILGAVTILNTYIIAIYYNLFSDQGQLLTRGEWVESANWGDYLKTGVHIFKMLGQSDLHFYAKGFIRGLDVIRKDGEWLFLMLVLLLGVCVIFASRKTFIDRRISQNVKKIALGSILFLAPFVLFFVIRFDWISFRNAFTSFIGLGLILEGLFDLGTRNLFLRRTKDLMLGILAVVFVLVNVSEITDFKNTSLMDALIAERVIEAAEGTGVLQGETEALIFHAKNSYVDLNKEYNEHIAAITSSDWLMTGAIRGIYGSVEVGMITPVSIHQPMDLFPQDFSRYVWMGLDEDLNVHRLKYEKHGQYAYRLFTLEEEPFGKIEYRYGFAYFSKGF